MPTTLNATTNRASVSALSTFSAFTMAEGPSTPQMLKGRVRSSAGRGGNGVILTLTDQAGNVRYTVTNSFGYYRFQNVLTWETYTIRVFSKRYVFSSDTRVFEFTDNPTDFDFTATNR
ncbi:MAG: carboxypeptidase regulatory-like domain-containing protein [Acidobacteria bacterium]|nr:carboxypeptidase regulatory-like domain-containing protein [Acidobacteriota bacterium]